jgi:ABC-2 type transport system ATP-binding protein
MGKTILISSHILHELSELCNTVGIIERGKLLFSGTVREALHRARVGHIIHVGVMGNTERAQQAAELLQKIPGVKKIVLAESEPVLSTGPGPSTNGHSSQLLHITFDESSGHSWTDLPNILVNGGFRLTKFAEEAVNLETAFMRLTKGLVQ